MSETNGITLAGGSTAKRTRRTYAPDVRPKALQMIHAGKKPEEVSSALGVTLSALRDWIIREKNGGILPARKAPSAPSPAPVQAAPAPAESVADLRATIAALNAELAVARAERDTLEHTVRILARL